MVYEEIAEYRPEFGSLSVRTLANKWYFPAHIKKDDVSVKIVYSKHEDKSHIFLDDVKKCLSHLKISFDLICVVPRSEVGAYSVTLLSIAKHLQKEFQVPFENVLYRRVAPKKKMTECSSREERIQVHTGTIALTRELHSYEKNILLLDDIKAGGDTKLICACLLTGSGALKVESICLGINTTDNEKSNDE